MKVALVYDRVNKWGGAERVLLALKKIFPEAPLFTSVHDSRHAKWADVFKIKTSFLQSIPKVRASHEFFASFMPIAFESFSFDEYDVVISVTSEAAKGIITKPKTLHICICLTPTRYLWSGYDVYFNNKLFKAISYPLVRLIRSWDKAASKRPDYYVSISKTVRERIKEYYDRESETIYPPATLENNVESPSTRIIPSYNKSNNYFLIVSRLVSYKRIDIAIDAFNKLSYPLKIVGTGIAFKKLKKKAKKNIEFLGNLTDRELFYYYKNAEALIFPGIEDFGLAMVEAQSFGLPIIAFRGGGAQEIIKEGLTGEFFNTQDSESLIKVLEKFDKSIYNNKVCINNAERFSYENFKKNFKRFLNSKIKEYFK